MSDVSGIPNMGFGGGNFFAPQFSYNPQINPTAGYAGPANYAQNVQNATVADLKYDNQLFQHYYEQSLGGVVNTTLPPEEEPGHFTDYNAGGAWPTSGGGGGGGEISYNNVTNSAPLDISGGLFSGSIGGRGFSGGGGAFQPVPDNSFSGGGFSGGIFGGDSFGSGGGGYNGPTINWSGVGNAAAGMGSSEAKPFDWSLFPSGGTKADPAPGMAMPGGLGSPMTVPQQTAEPQPQPGINWGNVGAAAGAGSTMPYTSGIEPDMTGGRTFASDAAPTAMPQQQQTTEPSAPEGARTYDVKPTVESAGTGGTANQAPTYGSYGGNVFNYIQDPNAPQNTADPNRPTSDLMDAARQRLAGLLSDPKTAAETTKAVETATPDASSKPSMRDFVSPANDYSKFQQPGAAPLSDLSNLPPEFPDFTKLYPEYRGGAPASADEPAAGLPAARPAAANAPRPPGDVSEFPVAKLAPNGQEPEAFIVHHTSGRNDPASIVADWRNNRPGVGTQYIMDRDGVIHDVAAEFGYTATGQALPSATGTIPGSQGLKNANIVGMELIANNDKDVTPAQIAALTKFANERYPNTPFYGHGEISTNKESDEGRTGAQAVLASRSAPFNFDWSNAPIPGPENSPTSGVNQGQVVSRPPADIPDGTPFVNDGTPFGPPAPAGYAAPAAVVKHTGLELARANIDTPIEKIAMERGGQKAVDQVSSMAVGQTPRQLAQSYGGLFMSRAEPLFQSLGITRQDFDKAITMPQTKQDIKMRFGEAGNFGPYPDYTGPEAAPGGSYADFRQSPNVDDRRAELASLTNTAADPFWLYDPSEMQRATAAEATPLARDLGIGDVKGYEAQKIAEEHQRLAASPSDESADLPLPGQGRDIPAPAEAAPAAPGASPFEPEAPHFFGDDQSITNQPLAPGELNANWNKFIYEATDRPTMARNESLGADPNPFTDFRQSSNVEDRRFDPQLTDEQRQANPYTGGKWTFDPQAPIPEGGNMGEALGTRQIDNLEANAIAQRMAGQGVSAAPRAFDDGTEAATFNERVSPFDDTTGMRDFVSPEQDYSAFQQPASRDALAKTMTFGGGFSSSPEPRQGGVGPQASLEPDFMDVIKEVESSGDPNKVTGSYKGLYQLNDKEFRKYGGTGSIFDPEENTKAASAKMLDETQRVQDRLGRELTPPEQYMVHQQGVAGALAHLANPDELAWKNFQSASGSNDARAKEAIWGNMTNEMKAQFGNDVNNVTSRDFLRLWDDRYYGILNR